jgi:hypothetical protein
MNDLSPKNTTLADFIWKNADDPRDVAIQDKKPLFQRYDAAGRALRYAGGSARGRLLHHGVGHDQAISPDRKSTRASPMTQHSRSSTVKRRTGTSISALSQNTDRINPRGEA